MIELYQVIEILTSNMLSFADSGKMSRQGIAYFETDDEIMATYQTQTVPYIIYQNEGFIHWRSGKLVKVNQGFVKRGHEKLERLIYSNFLGIPYNNLEDNQILLERNHLMMVELGAVEDA